MVERYMHDVDGCDCCELINYRDKSGLWVRHRDYEKLSDLCEKMTVLLKCVQQLKTPFGKEIRAAIAEWEAMK